MAAADRELLVVDYGENSDEMREDNFFRAPRGKDQASVTHEWRTRRSLDQQSTLARPDVDSMGPSSRSNCSNDNGYNIMPSLEAPGNDMLDDDYSKLC